MKISFNHKFLFQSNKVKRINFIDLARQRQTKNNSGVSLKKLIDKNINSVMQHGQYILGPEVNTLEEKLKNFTGSKYRSRIN